MSIETDAYLSRLQPLLGLPRETVPQTTAKETRTALEWAAQALQLELIEKKDAAPSFLLLPEGGDPPQVLFFASWHREALPVAPAAVEGAERLALAASLAAAAMAGARHVGLVVAPASSQGSLVLSELLREHRPRLQAAAAFWARIAPQAPPRRRVFLGARGRVVLGLWGGESNPYRIRDEVVESLRAEAYGPRPLDFDLLHKVAQNPDALDLVEESLADPALVPGRGEERLRRALFEAHGQVMVPPQMHPDRPRAWIVLEIAECMEPADLLRRVREKAQVSRVEMAEGFLWDRIGIHHPAVQAEIKLSKEVSQGPEIWPMAPWQTPSGVFTRELGLPLLEWGVPIGPSVAIRSPKAQDFRAIVGELSSLVLHSLEETPKIKR